MYIYEKFSNADFFTTLLTQLGWDDFIPADNLLALYVSKYGERTILHSLEKIDNDILAATIVYKYGKKWNLLKEKLSIDLLPNNGDDVVTYAENKTGNTTLTTSNNETTTNKVSAYDSDDFSNSENNTSIVDGNNITDDNSKRDYTKTSSTGNIEKVDKYIKLLYINNLCDIIFTDINKTVVTNIISLEV